MQLFKIAGEYLGMFYFIEHM